VNATAVMLVTIVLYWRGTEMDWQGKTAIYI